MKSTSKAGKQVVKLKATGCCDALVREDPAGCYAWQMQAHPATWPPCPRPHQMPKDDRDHPSILFFILFFFKRVCFISL